MKIFCEEGIKKGLRSVSANLPNQSVLVAANPTARLSLPSSFIASKVSLIASGKVSFVFMK
jgi:hypothetical protein